MALSSRLDLRQSQQLVLTPQLQQAIKLLQLSNMELGDFVAQEIEKNPLLDRPEGEDSPAAETPEPLVNGEAGPTASDTALVNGNGADSPLDTDVQDSVFIDDGIADRMDAPVGLAGAGSAPDEDLPGLDQRLSEAASLKDHIEAQLPGLFTAPMDQMISVSLIDLLDEAGYLRTDLEDVAQRLGASPLEVEAVLTSLQTLDPAGVFARDLPECLALQLKERDRYDPMIGALLEHLDLVVRNDRAGLRQICQCEDEDLDDMLAELRSLNPKPGLAFGGEAMEPVVPDVFVRKGHNGLWTVELNQETLPRVLVNQSYYVELNTRAKEKTEKAFLSECLANANWLVRALDQRQRTILKVTTELVRQQEGFFEHGVRALKPLTLRRIAEAINMHESTVSRVTSSKYVGTARGVFELKYFFTAAIKGADYGEEYSAEAVRHRIKELIDAEDPKKILSDDKLVAILRAEGIDIARRTVAKYREAMRIGSSVERRRQKRARA
ncbi:MAG: RNA polymerase factor sigma-54 [Rhodothalassiaceae bacterium]